MENKTEMHLSKRDIIYASSNELPVICKIFYLMRELKTQMIHFELTLTIVLATWKTIFYKVMLG